MYCEYWPVAHHTLIMTIIYQIQQLREELDAANEEKNQLKSDLQENVEMVRDERVVLMFLNENRFFLHLL